jgi:nucleotide-binding universal stress UspA family protein
MSDLADSVPDSAREAPAAAAVLVGVDGTEASRAAIALAAREARYRDAPLVAVQAYNGERPLGAPAAVPVSTLRSVEDERLDAESRLRDAVRAVLGDQAAGVEVHAVLGLAGRRIVETAHRLNAQLIVLATQGSASMLLGTVSQYVLRKAPCPVLIVPAYPARL